MIRIEGERERGRGGRPSNPVDYKEVEHKGQKYVIGTILQKGSIHVFVLQESMTKCIK
jgi:hypothetical protein